MSASDEIKSGGIATFTVKVNGTTIPDELSVFSVHVEKKVNRIASAKIVILDGEANTGTFIASSSDTFVPGAAISIEAGYDNTNQVIFSGIIMSQSIRIDSLIGSALEIDCSDAAVKMIVGRKSLTYSKQKDSDIISTIIGTYSGLTPNVTATTTTWPEQVQYYVTDWDYILSLAEANGLIVTTINGTVSVIAPDSSTSSVLIVTYGDNLYEFNAKLDATSQLGNVTSNAWDYKTQAIINSPATPNVAGSGNLTSKKLSDVIGLSTFQLQTSGPLETADLNIWSKAQIIKSEYSKITGEAKFQGTNLIDPGKYMTFAGLGDRFNGDYLIAGVVHDLSGGNWVSEVSLGLSPLWFTEAPDVMSPPASGLIPGARGLFNGTVKQMYEDPDSQYRILVNIPLFDANGAGIWARLSNFYSTSGAGAFFLPEVGDEVILGFLNEDPRYPVILGSLYSSTTIKPFTGLEPNDKNSIKAIVSKSGISVQFDDENKIWTVATPNKNTIIISDKDKKITIQDQNQNSIVMSESGIDLSSQKNITISAQQNVSIKGMQGVSIESSGGDVAIKGMNIKESADMQYSAQGGQMAQVSGGMELTLKGAMVMIN
ncbi:type VI secretion system tip protein VgrG [Flavobacterium sp. MC2016-06]|jgi:Rhs element Vgr protein|uniref:type VI secretion system tip protein VgrG n=1 Tax=Flavobacterium sp. MC2016-06 TaxID=2676308 RepID=UPI0012BADBAA|nr:type VI secretion system tip protein VgrG [Flavobacterium sp. MC2016-06]MBU3857589.1 type VI secretion system tip protein VgrG [Flavobacterium sp. MC2016-06]